MERKKREIERERERESESESEREIACEVYPAFQSSMDTLSCQAPGQTGERTLQGQ